MKRAPAAPRPPIRTPLEFVVGVCHVCQSAVLPAGGNHAPGEQLQARVAASVLLVPGVKEHLEFRRLKQDLREAGIRS